MSSASIEPNKQREIEAAAAEQGKRPARHKPFGHEWGSAYFGKWQTIAYALLDLLPPGAEILDVGSGQGWTSVFLAETGYVPTGIDIAPANVEDSRDRAARYGTQATFEAADMDFFDLGRTFDGVLVFDALHHSTRPRQVVQRVAEHLRPGGWVLFGEPSWLHGISPSARKVEREVGWVERGVKIRTLKADSADAGLGNFRRYFEGTSPHTGSVLGLGWQAARLFGARASTAPQMRVWLAAQRL